MHTTRTIALIALAITLACLGTLAALMALLGPLAGGAVGLGLAAAILALYLLVLRPWHSRWGTVGDEAARPLPGDGLVPGASGSTRAVHVDAPPEAVWPWLLQLGWGRGGWYSYDWIDNDGRPSATVLDPALQDLHIGDRILMTPELGFVVRSIDPPHDLVCLSDDGATSWCLHLEPQPDGSTRLLSRFRAVVHLTPASAPWWALADPGVFIMERRMLRGIAARAAA